MYNFIQTQEILSPTENMGTIASSTSYTTWLSSVTTVDCTTYVHPC
jgi:hypothetical protein